MKAKIRIQGMDVSCSLLHSLQHQKIKMTGRAKPDAALKAELNGIITHSPVKLGRWLLWSLFCFTFLWIIEQSKNSKEMSWKRHVP